MGDYSFWTRYLDVFDGVRIVARVRETPEVPERWIRADGPGVTFRGVPYYVGPYQYLARCLTVAGSLGRAIQAEDAVVLRVPSLLANQLIGQLRRRAHPYAVEVVGDPWEVFAPGTVHHPLRSLLRLYFTRRLRAQCRYACVASYVTRRNLQRRYPIGCGRWTTYYSSIELDAEGFVPEVAEQKSTRRATRIVFVGTLEQLYKGPDTLLAAVARCVQEGLALQVRLVGEGRYRGMLEEQAKRLGIRECADFLGQVSPGSNVRDELDRADLFVLPSRTEGLPRAMIEAMARGLPCLGSTAGGIPELLPAEDLVTPGDDRVLAMKMTEVLRNPAKRLRMARRNLQRAHDYRRDILQLRRREFYCRLRKQSEAWLRRSKAA